MNELKLILGWNGILALASVFSGILLGYLFGGFLAPRLGKALTKDKLDTKHPLYSALVSFIRSTFLVLGIYAALQIADWDKDLKGNLLLYWKVFAILVFTLAIARVGSGAFALYSSNEDGFLPSASILNNILRVLILITGGLVALQTLGISVAPALTALGVGGLAFALGLQETLSNLFAGLGVLLGKKVRVGDYISLETGEEGEVEDINWRTTSLKKKNGSTIIIPNAKMSKTTYTNFSLPSTGLWTDLELQVNPGTNTDLLAKTILESASEVTEKFYGTEARRFEKAEILFRSIGSSNLHLAVRTRIRHIREEGEIRSLLILSLQTRLEKAGINLSTPSKSKSGETAIE